MRGAFGSKDKPPAGFTLDNAAPAPPAGFELDAADTYEPTPTPNTASGGLGKAFVEGAKQTGRALGSAFDVVTGDEQDIYEDAKVTPDQTGAQQRFHQALTQRKDEYGDDGIWQGIKNVAGAVAEEPMGAFQEVGAQLPNSAAVMGGMFAGAKLGATAGPVGAIVGGIAGLLLGNTAIETGFIAQDQAREGELDTGKALKQGAIKGGVITGIDAATIGLNKLMFGAPGKAAAKASQEAVEGILAKAGVDMADRTAVTTALRLDPALKTAVLEGGKAAYIGALPGKLKKAAQAAAAMGSETVSEGAGEYLGSAAAGLDASFTEAVLEGLMSLPQSAGEAGISGMLAKRDQPGFEVNVPEDPNAPWPGYQVDEREASPGDVAAFNPPFPGTEGIQVETVPDIQGEAMPQTPLQAMAARFRQRLTDMQAGQGEQITIDAVPRESNAEPMSPVEALQQRGEDELARRLDKVEKRSAFEQADREAAPGKAAAAAQKEGELDAMAEQARYERELPPLQQMAARIRDKTADLAGERARLLREREEAQADDKAKAEQPTTEGIEVSEAFRAPANSAMADALRAAGVTLEEPKVKLADAAAQARDKIPDLPGEPFPDEIRPTSGKPYKSQASAENIIKIRKLKDYEPVEADGGWVLRKVADVDTAGAVGLVPGDETAIQGMDGEGAGPLPPADQPEGQSGPGVIDQMATGPAAQGMTLHPYEDELALALRTWSKRHDDAYQARPSYADEVAAFRKGFEDRAAGRDSASADLKDLAQRDYELGYSMGKYGAAHYEDWVTGKDKRQGPITTGPSRSGIVGTTGTIETIGEGTSPYAKDPNAWDDDDINALLDEAVSRNAAGRQEARRGTTRTKEKSAGVEKPAGEKPPKEPRAASDVAKELFGNTSSAIEEALTGLSELFGVDGSTKLRGGFPGDFNEETYAKAKPHFAVAWEAAKAAAGNVKELMEIFLDKFVAAFGEGMRPYLIQWIKEHRAELSDFHKEKGSDLSQQPEGGTALTQAFVKALEENRLPSDNRALRKFVSEQLGGIEVDNARLKVAQEELEAATAIHARNLIAKGGEDRAIYDQLVALYNAQPNLNIRTSGSIERQAYSTPAPLAFAAALTAKTRGAQVYEPSAGNGLLLIDTQPDQVVANELDGVRARNLQGQGFKTIQSDAVSAVPDGRVAPAAFDSVIANPPFGKAPEAVEVQGYRLEKIDHIIAARSLLAMKSDGRATLILAADKVEPGAIQGKDRVFCNWLYANYNVVGNFEVDGKLYSRQGASWPVRVISVAGRNVSDRIAPASLPAERVSTWEGVYEQAEPIASAVVDSNISDAEFIASIAGSVDLKAPEDRNGVPGSDGEPTGATGTQGGLGSGQGGNNGGAGPDGSGRGGNGGRSGGATGDGGRGGRGDQQPGLDAGEPAGTQPDGRGGPGGDAAGGRAGGDERQLNSDELQAKYRGVAQGQYQDEGVLTPVNMRDALHQALVAIRDDVGSLEEYVRQKLGYDTLDEVTADLMGLQIDTVAAAIYNIEHGTGVVIADQTGVGKGRQAAAIIRYAHRTGRTPIFATKGPDLFTDMYRDLKAIGSADLAPFIMNADVKIVDEDTELVVHSSLDAKKRNAGLDQMIATGQLPDGFDMLFFGYPQIQNPDQARRKIDALEALAENAILILDESHEAAGGSSNRGEVMRPLVNASAGVVYLSATFAKRADTMGLYFRTVLGKMVDSVDALVNIMATGGDQLQAILSNTLSRVGQLFRRERSFEGIDTLEVRDTDNTEEHARQADEATRSLRDIIRADVLFKKDEKKWKQWLVDQGYVTVGKGNKISETVTKTTFASVAHNYIRQLMLGLKAETAAERAIAALKRGERPTIALEHTMGSFLKEFVENRGAKDGDELTGFDYRYVLARGLARTRRIKIRTRSGQEDEVFIPLEVLSPETIKAYEEALTTIKRANVGIPVSPIDWIRQKLADAGYSSKEITNRKLRVDYADPEHPTLTTRSSVEFDKVKSRAEFNSGLVDVLIMNVSGATGASLHSSEKFKDQRRRMMIVAQPMADINMFMQMLGRINRTGQVSSRETVTDAQALPKGAVEAYGLPYYELLSADLPAEVRPTAILMKKMKSLNANVSSNTDSANTLDSALDLFNKYGDQVVLDYLRENKEMGELFGPMIGAQTEKAPEDFAAKVTGKLALLPVQKQIEFYDDVAPAYQSHIDYLDSVGQNDLRISIKDLKAKPIGDPAEVIYQTPAEIAYIVPNAFLGKYEVAKLTHPPTPEEVEAAIATELDGLDPEVYIEGVVVAKEEKEALYAEHLKQEKDAAEKDAGDIELSNDKRNQAGAKAARMAAELESLAEARKKFRREMNDGFRPGTIYNVDIDGQLMSGVVTKVKDVSKPNNTNPYAESKTEVTFMVNGDIRHFKMPVSKLKSRDVLQGKSWRADIASAFSAKQAATSTEERYLLTGNILGGLSRLEEGQKREIAYVTMDDGEIVPAVILPLSFNPGAGSVKRDVSMRYPLAVVEFLDAYRTDTDISRFGVASSDNTLRIIPTGATEFRVRVPSSKAAGGKWHQNKRLIDITGEFVSSSTGFMDVTVNAGQLERMLEVVLEQVGIYAPESQAEKAQPFVDKHAPRHSRGRSASRRKADVRAQLKALLTPNNALLKSGRLRVVQSDSDLPGHLQVEGDGVKGVVDPVSGKIYLVADNIGDNVKGVFLHEVGVHAGLKNLLGDKYQDVIRQMRGLRAIKKAAAVNAYARVPDGTLEAHVDEEALAYLVEDTAAADMSIVKKVLAAVRAWLFRHGILVKSLTPEDMLALAAAAARSYAETIQARPVTAGEAVQPQYYSRLGDVVDRYRDARRAEPESEFAEQNRKIREQNRPMWNRAKQILKRQLAPGGLLPEDVFKLKIERDSKFEVAELDIRSMLAHYEDAVKAAYNTPADALPDETQRALKLALLTPDPANYPEGIPQPVADHIFAMRQYIDRMSVEYSSILFTQTQALLAEGKDAAAAAKAELLNTIAGNIGRYVNRSYRAFDDPKWPNKVPDKVLDDARRYLTDQYEAKAREYDEWQAKAIERGETEKAARHAERAARLRDPERPERTLQAILKEGTAFDSMEGFIKESKLGAKDLSILKRRKDIAEPIRALLGEYIDPRINFAKSATKMNRLIFNQRFLDKVLEVGRGAFLFGADDRPAVAWKKIAAPSTEAYAPLSGYYTYPEVEQAFRDALGKEQMADWYRTVVKLNGIVKYGKTVLSPTTAMRNWMSAMFFAVANGHFDASQIRNSVKSLREYFTHKGDGLAYLRKLKNLGVIYDTPYAGEMMRLLQESKIEDTLVGGGHLGIKRALDMATRFYQFGDDFWKIMGFENEVALLIKHKGLSRYDAELQAAERIRNTYPTYSMVGQFVNKLRRFPLAGTFVSFPAEIVRTTGNMLRYLAQDMKDPDLRPLAMRRIAGLAIAAGFAHGLQVAFMAMAGVDDDEEEAFRDLAAPWQRNANILPLPWRDAKGNLEFIDISFLDPYNYWKRPINAILREQPFEDALRDIAPEVFAPFFGVDIAAGAIVEAITNRRETGGRVFNPQDDVFTQAGDIANHLRKTLQPGIASNTERMLSALAGRVSPSGREYGLGKETAALFGFRVSTHDPRAALYYKSFEFRDAKKDATSILIAVARDPNRVSDAELKGAFERAMTVRTRAYGEMARLVSAAQASGMPVYRVRQVLRQSGISKQDTDALIVGRVPAYRPGKGYLKQAVNKARILFPDRGAEIEGRRKLLRKMIYQNAP